MSKEADHPTSGRHAGSLSRESIARVPAHTVPAGELSQRKLAGRLGRLPLPKQIAVLAVWPLLEQTLNFLVTFVDTMRAGHLNAAALSALGIAGYIVWLLGMIQSAAGTGSIAIIARAAGARHASLANAALGQSMLIAVIAGVLFGATLFLLAPFIGEFVEFSGLELEYCIMFLRILSLATPMSFVLFVGCACCRAMGDTATPFWTMVVVNAVNIAANYAFVLGPYPLGGYGVAGIAAATGLAWTVGALSIVNVLFRGRRGMRLYLHRLAVQWAMVQRLLRIGLPSLAEASGIWIAQLAVLKIIGHVGSEGLPNAIALHAVAVRIEGISYLPGFALSAAAATLAGQYLGAGDANRAKSAVLLCWFAGAVIMGSMGLLFLLIPEHLIAIVSNEPSILTNAAILLRICGPSEIFLGTYLILSQAMRGAGSTRMPLILSYFSVFCVRLPAAYILGLVLGYKLVGIWFALCGEVVFRGMIFGIFFLRGRWFKAKL
jgi:putative MATE family efflux protein